MQSLPFKIGVEFLNLSLVLLACRYVVNHTATEPMPCFRMLRRAGTHQRREMRTVGAPVIEVNIANRFVAQKTRPDLQPIALGTFHRQQIGLFELADHLLASVAKPSKFGIVHLYDQAALFINGVIATG